MKIVLLLILIAGPGSTWPENAFGVWQVNRDGSTGPHSDILAVRFEWHTKGEVFPLDTMDASGRSATSSTILYFDGQPRRNMERGQFGPVTWHSVSVYSAVALYNAVALAIDPGSPSTVYTVSSSGVFKSSDGGMSWNSTSSGLPDWSSELGDCCFRPRLAVDPQNSARVYLGIAIDGAPHVFQSSDGGQAG